MCEGCRCKKTNKSFLSAENEFVYHKVVLLKKGFSKHDSGLNENVYMQIYYP